ncbi:MAG: FKBP-type peptidyl-prolyl cis-trans isomerase [Gemmatimonadales bacterium]
MPITSRPTLATMLLLAACSGAESKRVADSTAAAAAAAAAPAPEPAAPVAPAGAPDLATVTFAPSLKVDLAASTKLPSGLYIRDITVGKGATVKAGQIIKTHYWGYFTDGNLFETSEGASPIEFPIGVKAVVDGWDEGIIGMKVGGKRQLIIPAALGYGQAGRAPKIGPNTNLVFTVQLLGITK